MTKSGSIHECPKCGTHLTGKPGCCAPDGAWSGKCGNENENKEHTWGEGWRACRCKNKHNLHFESNTIENLSGNFISLYSLIGKIKLNLSLSMSLQPMLYALNAAQIRMVDPVAAVAVVLGEGNAAMRTRTRSIHGVKGWRLAQVKDTSMCLSVSVCPCGYCLLALPRMLRLSQRVF